MAKVLNEPTNTGYELGYHISRIFETCELKPERCSTCAFRQGTYPNGCESTLMDAVKCIAEGMPFNCHEENKPCAGYVAFRSSGSKQKLTVPWDFSYGRAGDSR